MQTRQDVHEANKGGNSGDKIDSASVTVDKPVDEVEGDVVEGTTVGKGEGNDIGNKK